MRIKHVVELDDFEAAAITGTLATLNEIVKHAEERDVPEFDDIHAVAERAAIALKDFYKECYL